ncbi:MAG: FAD-dependent thymidylate synthase [Candidatus Eisenbacteria bacterium]|nr:FAD-dependent thymidylate synthase [Candidatus Eisenbacteria bacterium]
MEVILAGYNLDRELIADLARATKEGPSRDKTSSPLDPDSLTPETLSAAYARISRDPRPIPELRADARQDVARARKSNTQIVFGFGHASVAEHAVFNFDILGISRLAIEALEASRLGSYTEKSQRYILLERDALVPPEIAGTPWEAEFRALLADQHEGYRRAYERLVQAYESVHPEQWADARARRELQGAAKEDARYFLALATTGQLGATMNARTLEGTVRRLAADPLSEVRELGERLHTAVASIAPSLVRHTEADAYRRDTPSAVRARLQDLGVDRLAKANADRSADLANGLESARGDLASAVRLIGFSPDGETDLIAALISEALDLSWARARERAAACPREEREAIVRECLARLTRHDAPMRAFELPDFTYELIVSASCFAQLKRHRLATLLPQPYRPHLGITIPPAFADTGLERDLTEACARSEALYRRIASVHPEAAVYALTNAHRRRVILKVNARELYHVARLRMDRHAQWDIRVVATEMIRQARERAPLVMMAAMGKDEFGQA